MRHLAFIKPWKDAMFTVIFPPLQFVKIWKTASDVCRQTISIFTIHTGRLLTFPSIRWKKRWILFSKLKKEGKIRAIGASNVTAKIIEKYCSLGQLDVIQEKYSLLDTHIADKLLPVCQKHHVSIQAYSPLEQGLLTGKVTQDTVLSPTDVRNKNKFWAQKSRLHILNVLQKLTPYTEKYSCSLSNLIIYLTAASLPDLHVLCGARKPEQIIDNVKNTLPESGRS